MEERANLFRQKCASSLSRPRSKREAQKKFYWVAPAFDDVLLAQPREIKEWK